MARFIMATALLLATSQLNVLVASADEQPTESTLAFAESANLDPVALQGAINGMHLTTDDQVRDYLYFLGALKRPSPPEAPPGIMDQLADCESHGDWSANTGNGYYGGIQFDLDSWKRAGGWKYTSRPDYATRTQQIEIGWNWQASQGWGAWPYCAVVRLGMHR